MIDMKFYHKAKERKIIVEPLYIGFSKTLNGKETTLSFIKIPK